MFKWLFIAMLLVVALGLVFWKSKEKHSAESSAGKPLYAPREVSPHVPLNTPIFYLSFDETNSPTGSLKIETIEAQDTAFAEGIKGRALMIGKGGVDYVLTGEQPARPQGTICLWIRPLDWDDESYLTFLTMDKRENKSRKTFFRVYRPFHTDLGLVVLKQGASSISLNYHVSRVSAWKKQEGRWHQVVFVWKDSQGTLYVDGLEIASKPDIGDPLKEADIITIGAVSQKYVMNVDGNTVAETTWKTTAIDEVAIYDYAWDGEEVKRNFEQSMGRLEDLDDF